MALLVGGGLVGGIFTYLVSEGVALAERTGAYGSLFVGSAITLIAVFLFWVSLQPLLGLKLGLMREYLEAKEELEK